MNHHEAFCFFPPKVLYWTVVEETPMCWSGDLVTLGNQNCHARTPSTRPAVIGFQAVL